MTEEEEFRVTLNPWITIPGSLNARTVQVFENTEANCAEIEFISQLYSIEVMNKQDLSKGLLRRALSSKVLLQAATNVLIRLLSSEENRLTV